MYKTFAAFLALALMAAAPFAQAAGGRIGVVDVQAVLAKSDAGKAAQTELQAFGKKQKAALDEQQAKLKKEHDAIVKNASIQTDAAQKKAQAGWAKEYQAFQEDVQKRQQAFAKKRAEVMQPLQAKLYNVIASYADSHNYDLILFKSAAIYSKDSLDLTDDILRAFNAAEAKSASK